MKDQPQPPDDLKSYPPEIQALIKRVYGFWELFLQDANQTPALQEAIGEAFLMEGSARDKAFWMLGLAWYLRNEEIFKEKQSRN